MPVQPRGSHASPASGEVASEPIEFVVGDEPDAVPQARRFAARTLASQPSERTDDALLVANELVTNAALHGVRPIVLRIATAGDRVRIEVRDSSRAVPVVPRQSLSSMTGRGLALVAAVADAWGVEPADGAGKVVWAELSGDPRPADGIAIGGLGLEEFADLTAADDSPEPRYEIKLGAVPTRLLLDAKAHIDNVVRELTLVKNAGARRDSPMPPETQALIHSVTEEFAEARQEIKRQALAAAARGDAFTDLTLHLPLAAAEAGEHYLAALEEIDWQSRDAQLLTLAPPASHRAFRRWYVNALVEQLRAVARGDEPPLPPLFPQVLAEEVSRLSMATASPSPSPSPAGRWGSSHTLSEWRLTDAIRVASTLRSCTSGSTSMEQAAQRIVSYLHMAFETEATEAAPIALTRLFKTEELGNLPAELQAVARNTAEASEQARFLTLLATTGDEPDWCDRRRSRAHQVIPVLSADAIENAPMVSALIRELGVDIDTVMHGTSTPERLTTDFDVFHVENAAGNPNLSSPEFVSRYDIKSVLGFGGLLPSGHVFAVVLFARVHIPPETARLFRTIALSAKLALLPYVEAPVFAGHDIRPQRVPISDEARIHALEEMLEVHERTVLEQAQTLEQRDEQLRREAETVDTLRRVGEALSAVLDVDSVVQLTTTAAVDVAGAGFGAFFYNVVDEVGESYMLYTIAGAPREAFSSFPMPRNTPVFGPTFRGDGVVRSDDITKDPRYGKVAPHYGMPPGHLPVRSYLAAPVLSPTSGEVLGGLFLGHADAGVFDERAERLLVGIAAQTAIALDNAALYRRERQTALQLQQALLPVDPATNPHVTLAHRYRPGTEGLQVGGDWYDVIALDDDRVALVIGDVMGRGIRAAATMGQLRTSIRAFATLDLSPPALLARLNQIVVDLPDDQIATCLYAVYDTARCLLTYASAGHLPPVLVKPDGETVVLPSEQGPPLGIPFSEFGQHELSVPAGSALALFTDGLVENRLRPADEGIAAMRELLHLADTGPEQICDRLLDGLAGPYVEDDIALLYASFR